MIRKPTKISRKAGISVIIITTLLGFSSLPIELRIAIANYAASWLNKESEILNATPSQPLVGPTSETRYE